MKRLKQVLDIKHKKNTQDDWDDVLLITGDEGISKSTLGLHMIEDWLNKLYGEVKEEHIKFIGLDREQFLKALKDANKYEMLIYDESGDITNKRSMSDFNVSISQAYQVIRGDNLFTILILPSVFDLDGFFTKRRARGLIHVYARGRFAYWNKSRLRKTVAINQFKYIKSVWTVKPLFYDTFAKYKGILKDPYDKKKQRKIKDIRKELYDRIISKDKKGQKFDMDKKAFDMSKEFDEKTISKFMNCSERTVRRMKKRFLDRKGTEDI